MIIRRYFIKLAILLFLTGSLSAQTKSTDTLRLFLIGNSFSGNASTYLPQLAEEGGHPLVIGRAELGGCSLQTHWEIAEAAEANPDDPKGKQYKGRSLRMLLSDGKWDIVTIQQNSMNSGDVETYRPYAKKLYDYIKSIQPEAEVVMHQTWAYRSDAEGFSKTGGNKYAGTAEEMWEKSRNAYHTIAAELGVRLIPNGDAFHRVSMELPYNKDKNYDFTQPVYPFLPKQENSLHVGYYWDKNKKLSFDSHHANTAGCFLGSLVWYAFLFGESPENLRFTPKGVPSGFASQLRKAAWSTVQNAEKANQN